MNSNLLNLINIPVKNDFINKDPLSLLHPSLPNQSQNTLDYSTSSQEITDFKNVLNNILSNTQESLSNTQESDNTTEQYILKNEKEINSHTITNIQDIIADIQINDNFKSILSTTKKDQKQSQFINIPIHNFTVLNTLPSSLDINTEVETNKTINSLNINDTLNQNISNINHTATPSTTNTYEINLINTDQTLHSKNSLQKNNLLNENLRNNSKINKLINSNIIPTVSSEKLNEFLTPINLNTNNSDYKTKSIQNPHQNNISYNTNINSITLINKELNTNNIPNINTNLINSANNTYDISNYVKTPETSNKTNVDPIKNTKQYNNLFKIAESKDNNYYNTANISQNNVLTINFETTKNNHLSDIKYLNIIREYENLLENPTDKRQDTNNSNMQISTNKNMISYLNKAFNQNLDIQTIPKNIKTTLDTNELNNINPNSTVTLNNIHLKNIIKPNIEDHTNNHKSNFIHDTEVNINNVATHAQDPNTVIFTSQLETNTNNSNNISITTQEIIDKIINHVKIFKNLNSQHFVNLDFPKFYKDKKLEISIKIDNNNNIDIKFITNTEELYKTIGFDASYLKDSLASHNLNLKNMQIIVKEQNDTNLANNFEHAKHEYNHYTETKDLLNILKESAKILPQNIITKGVTQIQQRFMPYHYGKIQVLA